jgi:leucyl aminopeptidase
MSDAPKLGFASFASPDKGVLVIFADESLKVGSQSAKALAANGNLLARVAAEGNFKGKIGSALDLMAPHGLPFSRICVVGSGKAAELSPKDFLRLGGVAAARLGKGARDVGVFAELTAGPMTAEQAADLAQGMQLRAYAFDRYKTKRKEDEDNSFKGRVTVMSADPAAARKAWRKREAVVRGVALARDLVNEPPNILYPEEFARRAQKLESDGLSVETLDPKAMRKLGMGALLGVALGSRREARLVIMRWNGGKRGEPPVAFIGKGVTFDTGGISIKPAASMEDMKGDMAGAACVTGLMQALAARKAKVNAIGAIGLVENMPDGNAQRPGDIVTSMSGQTIEIINTDAEGRLVLADVLWYVKQKFKPHFMINLATLTGAIIVALGHEYAGMFSNNDTLSERLTKAGEASGERVWRMPLAAAYDKLIDSKFADMKNTGGRAAGSITAAQFLHRFVDETPWAHLDIAGTGFASPANDINTSWGAGWGVRLLDTLVVDNYEG